MGKGTIKPRFWLSRGVHTSNPNPAVRWGKMDGSCRRPRPPDQPRTHLPHQPAGASLQAIGVPVVGAEPYTVLAYRGGQADRAARAETPLLWFRVGLAPYS